VLCLCCRNDFSRCDQSAKTPTDFGSACKSDATRFAAGADMTSAIETNEQKRLQILILIAKVLPQAWPLLQK